MPHTTPIRQLISDVGLDTALNLLGIFKKDALKRLKALEAYQADGGDLEEVRRQAHSLKGLCGTYGAAKSSDAAERLQTACDDNQLDDIDALIADVIAIVPDEIEAVLKTALNLKKETD